MYGVVPTYVGVFRVFLACAGVIRSCPHIRGGVPGTLPTPRSNTALSPHTWGCSAGGSCLAVRCVRCPHIRGGVSLMSFARAVSKPLSPHTWGCSSTLPVQNRARAVVPTYVGVFRTSDLQRFIHSSCPHIRGGVPARRAAPPTRAGLSPHTWGCSSQTATTRADRHVVPTYVGVFLSSTTTMLGPRRCPHIRGGVPRWSASSMSSLIVVPTYVGVFRRRLPWHARHPRCPHIRGGVPDRVPYDQWARELSPHTWGCSFTRI